MRLYIEYFQTRAQEISQRLKRLTTPVSFIPVITSDRGRLGYGFLESTNETELKRVKQNLIDLINLEFSHEEFVEKIKTENENSKPDFWDPVKGEYINIFQQKDTGQLMSELELDKYDEEKT